MNKLIRLIISLIQIGGGLAGLGIIGRAIITEKFHLQTVIINVAFIFIFWFGILAGIALIRRPRTGLLLSAAFQAIQIPIFKGPVAAYSLFSGASLNLYQHQKGPGFQFLFGSSYHFSIGRGESLLVGVNILALVLFIYLAWEIWNELTEKKIRDLESNFEHQARHIVRGEDEHTHGSPLRRALH